MSWKGGGFQWFIDCSQSSIFAFRSSLQAAILRECQNYLGSGSGLAIPDARSLGTFKNQDGRLLRKTRYISGLWTI